MRELTPIHRAVEEVADRQADYRAKQSFINTVYERFFQGYSVNVADTHGIVYTPEEIVDYMCAAIEEILKNEFGKKLGDEGVNIIDPATGTGNFVVNLLRRTCDHNMRKFEDFYKNRLFANEVMLMPYYIASLNIENEYYRLRGKSEAFPGLCFVDTLDLTEAWQLQSSAISEENSQRVKRQLSTDINVIIGNPPYNVGQINESDNNKNRKYEVIDKRIKETYNKDSNARYTAKVVDAYVKFFRWAADRLEDRDGIVCYVTNNNFVDAHSFDGFRKHLLEDFHRVFHLDLGGNLRKGRPGEKIANVFDIRVGVGITVAIRNHTYTKHDLFYSELGVADDKRGKLMQLRKISEFCDKGYKIFDVDDPLVEWNRLRPDSNHYWFVSDVKADLANYISMGKKAAKGAKLPHGLNVIFRTYSLGISTNRDPYVFDYDCEALGIRVSQMVHDYNTQVAVYHKESKKLDIDSFVDYRVVKWSRNLKRKLKSEDYATYAPERIRVCHYRPFSKKYVYFDRIMVDEMSQLRRIFPNIQSEKENRLICVAGVGNRKEFGCLISKYIPSLDLAFEKVQCFPFYVYDVDGSNRRDNITNWVLDRFRMHYSDPSIDKWDVFYYVYGILHHHVHRERYALDLTRELPRIPFAPDFRAFVEAGRALSDLHLNYDSVKRFELTWRRHIKPVSYKLTQKMRPGPKRSSKTGDYQVYDMLQYNRTLTLRGIPERVFEYRLGNRSALEWVVAQFHTNPQRRSDIVHDPNGYSDDEQYILKLIERVITVSLRTVDIVEDLAKLPFRDDSSND